MDKRYILCIDEGHYCGNPAPNEEACTTALMVNPRASQPVLIDSAAARIARIIDITKPFTELEREEFDFSRRDAIRLLITLHAMGQEIAAILDVAQDANHRASGLRSGGAND